MLKVSAVSMKIKSDIKGLVATFIDVVLLMDRFHYSQDQ